MHTRWNVGDRVFRIVRNSNGSWCMMAEYVIVNEVRLIAVGVTCPTQVRETYYTYPGTSYCQKCDLYRTIESAMNEVMLRNIDREWSLE